jgi:hypothetical protein
MEGWGRRIYDLAQKFLDFGAYGEAAF